MPEEINRLKVSEAALLMNGVNMATALAIYDAVRDEFRLKRKMTDMSTRDNFHAGDIVTETRKNGQVIKGEILTRGPGRAHIRNQADGLIWTIPYSMLTLVRRPT